MIKGQSPFVIAKVLRAFQGYTKGQIIIVSNKDFKKFKKHLELIKQIRSVNELITIK